MKNWWVRFDLSHFAPHYSVLALMSLLFFLAPSARPQPPVLAWWRSRWSRLIKLHNTAASRLKVWNQHMPDFVWKSVPLCMSLGRTLRVPERLSHDLPHSDRKEHLLASEWFLGWRSDSRVILGISRKPWRPKSFVLALFASTWCT